MDKNPQQAGKAPASVFRDPSFTLFVGSVILTGIGLYKLAIGDNLAAVVFCVVAAGLGLIAKRIITRRGSKGFGV